MAKKTGVLTLIPTPLDNDSPLEKTAYKLLLNAVTGNSERNVIVIEDHKPCRRRWIHWGLPREAIDRFICLNEHTASEVTQQLLGQLKNGNHIYLMSDGGLPAFCDPGRELVNLCHHHNVKVTATPFCNSFALAVALSGFPHFQFEFHGRLPKKGPERSDYLKKIMGSSQTQVLMDTPYRLKSLLEQLCELTTRNHVAFLGLDLNMSSEQLLRGSISQITKQVLDFKREFVLVICKNNPD